MSAPLDQTATSLQNSLAGIVGKDNVTDDKDELDYFSRDLSFEHHETADVVAAPGTTNELSDVVALAQWEGRSVVPRGGGMSYTKGYTPNHPGSILIDLRRMNSIVEVNPVDRYAIVECGATWEHVFESLRKQRVRTPYFGPLSGRYATVGGALSQNSLFYGSGRYGTVAESVIGLEVVTADGTVVHTGSWARHGSSPFLRYNGPDLTGMFLSDTGAMGVKARAAIRVVPWPEVTLAASFAARDFQTSIATMRRVQGLGVAAEVYGLDPFYHETLAKAGMRFLQAYDWSVHVVIDAHDEASGNALLDLVRRTALQKGVTEIENTAPLAFRGDPFGSVQSVLLGPDGQLWLPIHAFLPYSKASAAADAVSRFFADHAEQMHHHSIRVSLLTAAAGDYFVFEPAFYWYDELGRFRLERISDNAAQLWKSIPADHEARATVLRLRRGLAELFDDLGGVHIQIGKYYEFPERLEPASFDLVAGFKHLVDPNNHFNPGALQLPRNSA